MTASIDPLELYRVAVSLPMDDSGFVKLKPLLSAAAKQFNCAELTIRNYIRQRPHQFELKYNQVRVLKVESLPSILEDQHEFDAWQQCREATLNEVADFLQVQTPSPYLENTLVKVAVAREELRHYNESNLENLLMELRREYNFVPKSLTTGSMINILEGETNEKI